MSKQGSPPETVKLVNTPLPAGIEAPVKEKPSTVVDPAETVNPLAAASPPEALTTVAPVTLNWNPPISISLSYVTA